MLARRRWKPLLALVAAAAGSVTIWSASRDAGAGLLDHRIKDFYKSRILSARPVKARPARSDFMRPYDPELMLVLTENHVLDGYRGQDLSAKGNLTRYEVAYLLGRFIRLVNSRDGLIFKRRKSRDHQAMWLPRKDWGMFEAEDALSEGLLTPTWQEGWWERTVSRYQLAAEVGRILRALAPHYELITYFEIYPLPDIDDFVMPGHPNEGISKTALVHGVMGVVNGRFRGGEPVTTHDMVELLDRLITIVDGYQRKPAPPLPALVPDGSDDAFPRRDPFPDALRTKYQDARELVDKDHEDIYQRKQFEDQVRDIRDDP